MENTSEPAIMIRTKGLSKSFGKVQALRELEMQIPCASVGLLGHNGAGKSTLIRILLGLADPTRGEGWVLGHHIATDAIRIRQQIGYMPEHDCLIDDMEGIRFVAYMGMLSGLPAHDAMQRAHEVLYYVGIVDERYRKIDTYSTGMKQKIKLAQALVHDPQLIFLDEPTNGMDPRGRQEMLDLIKDISQSQGKQLLLSSHLLQDVQQVCEEVILLEEGKLKLQTSMHEALDHAGNRWRIRVRGESESEQQLSDKLKKEGFSVQLDKRSFLLTKPDGIGAVERKQVLQIVDSLELSLRMLAPDQMDLEDVYLEHTG